MDLRELPAHAFRRHPWEIARARFFARRLRRHIADPALSVLDFGSGDGFFARHLLGSFPAVREVTCFDPGYASPPPPADGLHFTAVRPDQVYDVLVLLDVLEHVANDQAALHDALACLRPGGWMLLSVPAHPLLFSRHDQRLGHKRRYTPAALLALAENEDVAIVEHGQLFATLLVPRALAKLREVVQPPSGDGSGPNDAISTAVGTWRGGPGLTRAVALALGLDAACMRVLSRGRASMPGLSTWLLARKP